MGFRGLQRALGATASGLATDNGCLLCRLIGLPSFSRFVTCARRTPLTAYRRRSISGRLHRTTLILGEADTSTTTTRLRHAFYLQRRDSFHKRWSTRQGVWNSTCPRSTCRPRFKGTVTKRRSTLINGKVPTHNVTGASSVVYPVAYPVGTYEILRSRPVTLRHPRRWNSVRKGGISTMLGLAWQVKRGSSIGFNYIRKNIFYFSGSLLFDFLRKHLLRDMMLPLNQAITTC